MSAPVSGKKVLIIEDEVTIRHALAEKFNREGFVVCEAADGIEGLVRAEQFHPDVILLDCIMPHQDGIETLKQLRQSVWGKFIPVLFMSNITDSQKIEEARVYTIQGYSVKIQETPHMIVDKVRSLLHL